MNIKPLALLLVLVGFIGLAGSPLAQAQDYPNRPVTLVVPYPAGGGLDVLARTLAQKLADRLGKPFVVDNRPGRHRDRGELGRQGSG